METAYIIFECDAWHSYASMTVNSIIGVATSYEGVRDIIAQHLEENYEEEITECIEDGVFDGDMDDFIDFALKDLDNNGGNQTQSLNEYLGVEFYVEALETNTLTI